MITSLVIICLSLAMLFYWFRCSCLLILESSLSAARCSMADAVIRTSNEMEAMLQKAGAANQLDQIRDSLDRDLNMLAKLMRSAGSGESIGDSLECKMLMIDYKINKIWYAVARRTAATKAHDALREMSRIVGYMASEFDGHLAASQQ